jgi:5'-deoxynucleotidase YfbR-like HD superfamily hydrolase
MLEFSEQIYNLAHIARYSVVPRIRSESVAEHSFFVASIVVQLHDTYEFNIGTATTMAVVHDWAESWVDDITVKTKQEFPAVAEAIKAAEYEIVQREFPESAKYYWEELHYNKTVEAMIVKYADALQVLQYAASEIMLGNSGYMLNVFNSANERAENLIIELEQFRRAQW